MNFSQLILLPKYKTDKNLHSIMIGHTPRDKSVFVIFVKIKHKDILKILIVS
jgi:hypothetical protein